MLHGERQARVDPDAIDQDRAGAALAVVAAFLGPSELQVLAQRVERVVACRAEAIGAGH
jgi:hypothetical protein